MIRASIAAILLAGHAAFGQVGDEPYVWPLDLPRELTSSFGEFRPGRYHVGIDLRTGPIGKNVYAADDGHVVRIGCSPNGYGKVIYLALRDGNIAVYGHLDEFASPVDAYVRRAQHAARRYTVDLRPEANELPITRGQLIAKSGQTGIGVPHLHYEIRDRLHVPINPGLLGVDWPDTTAPIFRKVAVMPLEPESTVNGDLMPIVREAVAGTDGSYTVAGTIRASGPFAIGVEVFDPAPGGSRLGVYRLKSGVKGGPAFEIVHDRLSYDHLNDGAAAYEPALSDRGQFLMLWRKPGNESEIYPQGPDDGRIEVSAPSEIGVVAEDFRGNRATLTINVRPDADAETETQQPDAPALGRGTVSFEYTGALFVVSVSFDADEAEAPALHAGGSPPETMRRVGPRTFRTTYRPNKSFADTSMHVEHPRVELIPERVVFLQHVSRPLPWSAAFGGLRLSSRQSQAYGMLALRAVQAGRVSPNDELTPVSEIIEVWPPNAVLDGSARLSMDLNAAVDSPQTLLIYRQGKEKWEPLELEDRNGQIVASTSQLGTFAVMDDQVAPKVRLIEPASGVELVSRRPEIRLSVTDGGSGIDAFDATIGNQWLLMEYDPEQDLLVWERDEDLPAGAGTVVVEVTDRAGNRTRQEVSLLIPD